MIARIYIISFLVIIAFLTSSFTSIFPRKARIEVTTKICRYDSQEYLNELKVLKDGKIIRHIEPNFYKPTWIEDLDTGNYVLEFSSIFGKTISYNYRIPKAKRYDIELCLDYIDYSKESFKPIISRLKNDETYSIKYQSKGCFHSQNDCFTISKLEDKYYLKRDTTTKELSQKDIEAIMHFEMELNCMHGNYGCTTQDYYLVEYGDTALEIKDGGCIWNGFSYLGKQLFGDFKPRNSIDLIERLRNSE